MGLDDVKNVTSSSEFYLWQEYLDWKVGSFDRLVWQLAAIAAEVRRSYVKEPRNVKIEDFVLKFRAKQDEPVMTAEERCMAAKQFWFAVAGLTATGERKG